MGRPKGSTKAPKAPNLDETTGGGGRAPRYLAKRNVHFSIEERIRERFHPDLITEHWAIVLGAGTPVWIPDNRAKHGFRIEPDPNPLLPSPNLAQRNEAVKTITERGWGQTVQSVVIDAKLRQQLSDGLPEHLLEKPNYRILAKFMEILKQESMADVVDAELVEPLQLPSQTLQEPCQVTQEEKLEQISPGAASNNGTPGTNNE